MDIISLLISVLSILFISGPSQIEAQQPYDGNVTAVCDGSGNSNSAFGYTCNGPNSSCQSFLTFRSQSPYNSVSSISQLLRADPSRLAQLNSVAENATFDTNQVVLVPVNCSCSGKYYQSNTTYFVAQNANNYFSIANTTFESLTTCQALQDQNSNMTINSGTTLVVPIRCACPTKNQSESGVNYLLSYVVTLGQTVSIISTMFGVDTEMTLVANGLSDKDNIYPFTTLLVPLQAPPSSSEVVAPPPPPPAVYLSSSHTATWVYVLAGLFGGGLVLGTGIFGFYFFSRKNKSKTETITTSKRFVSVEKANKNNLEEKTREVLESIPSISQSLKMYTYEQLQSATKHFSPSCWIKGSVYRGTINGDFAAIKRMDGDVSNEIDILNKISHFNIIGLSGVCFNAGHWYLIYEYAVNGPLSDWIYSSNNYHKCLNWTRRVQIALDVAMGLNYIHNYTSPPYVHKNLTSSNVLLDSDCRAKIANFRLARSAEMQDDQFSSTSHIVGTRGYMAPEYLENGFVSMKLDVYAFGVLLLEILTGEEVTVLYDRVNLHLSELLIPVVGDENAKERLSDFMDPSLEGNYPVELAVFAAKLVDSCTRKDPSDRPGMDEIAQSLSRILNASLNLEFSDSISGY
ncbi:hypothetical protein RHGRI_023517 [Rhododendron griersonianum]|uniref:LysM domain receptor-like kinase 4 n=1 Tax=Rhododendron griersonianum TaxID=479676 RepID=A0AAV6JAZ5_9ERIC|nr:hypothetical protein RHGRI_023517 [Rhododendron griersonianum]